MNIGGRKYQQGKCQKKIEKYIIDEDRWCNSSVPRLNIGRSGASGCMVGLTAYVFGGMNLERKRIIEIESIDFTTDGQVKCNNWTVINLVNDNGFMPRSDTGFVNFTCGKILIFGGILDNESKANDFFMFDVRKKTL